MKLKKKYHVKVIIIHTPTSNGVNVVVSKKKKIQKREKISSFL